MGGGGGIGGTIGTLAGGVTGGLIGNSAGGMFGMGGGSIPGYGGPTTSPLYRPGGEIIQNAGGSGFQGIAGGVNRYGEARPDQILLRGADGNLDPRFRASMGESFQALKDKGMTEGDTKSALLARQAQEQMRQQSVDQLRGMQSSGVTQGMRNLAMRGGVGTGSRERLMRDATRQGMRGMQGIGRDNSMANLQISQADEAMKNQLLQGIGGVEQGIQGQNIKMLAQDIAAQNMGRQNMYGEDMRALGAIETGKAQAAAGQSSGGLFK